VFEKNNVRRKNKQSGLNDYLNLLSETKDLIKYHVLVKKQWRRFWNTIEGYKAGHSCIDILKMYFSYRCKENIQ
jgi:hypothetical protein